MFVPDVGLPLQSSCGVGVAGDGAGEGWFPNCAVLGSCEGTDRCRCLCALVDHILPGDGSRIVR